MTLANICNATKSKSDVLFVILQGLLFDGIDFNPYKVVTLFLVLATLEVFYEDRVGVQEVVSAISPATSLFLSPSQLIPSASPFNILPLCFRQAIPLSPATHAKYLFMGFSATTTGTP